MPFQIIRDDITRVAADAIVNTANPEPTYGNGTDHAVYMAAGAEELLAERRKIGRIHPGEAVVTSAFRLPAKYIIHTVGPVWQGGDHGEEEILASCYRKPLLLAEQMKCQSVAFPLISAGTYGFPKDRALDIALRTIEEFLEDSEMDVRLVVFNRKVFELSASLVDEVSQYIDDHYVEEQHAAEYGGRYEQIMNRRRREMPDQRREMPDRREESLRRRKDTSAATDPDLAPDGTGRPHPESAAKDLTSPHPTAEAPARPSLTDMMDNVGENFQQRLLRIIDGRGMKDSEVYKRANVDRKLFSKIRCNPDYCPKKETTLALAIALKLDLDETKDLLSRAGHALSPGNKADLIVQYCIDNRIYDIFEVNALLFKYGQQCLGV